MYSTGQINIILEGSNILLSLVVLTFLFTSSDRGSRLNRLFIRVVVCNIAAMAADVLAWGFDGSVAGHAAVTAHAAVIARTAKFISYVLQFLLIPLLADYVNELIGKSVQIGKTIPRVMYTLFCAAFLLVVISQYNGMFYTFDETGSYQVGEMFWLSQAAGTVFLIIITAFILRHGKSIGKSDTLFLLSYPFFPILAMGIHVFTLYEIEFIFVASTVSIVTCYGGIQARQAQQAVRLMKITLNSLENIMDGINTSIYVVEPETCRLLFVNKWLKAFYGMENDDLTGEFCYKAFRGFDEMCSFCPCVRLAENPEQTIEWEEFLEPYGIYVRHLFCYIDWPNKEKAILHYGVDITDIREKTDLLVKLEKQERELAENRMSIMLSQIQPHFLYNALSAIQDLCVEDPETAQQTVIEFSQYLRGNLNSLDLRMPIPFERELRHVETYLAIEKKRFGENLKIIYEVKARDFMLPALSLQLIAENAVRHGVTKRPDGGSVTIKTRENESAYIITVKDDGVGFDTGEEIKNDGRSHIGIKNVRSRLEAMSGGTLEIKSRPGKGTTAVIKIPK